MTPRESKSSFKLKSEGMSKNFLLVDDDSDDIELLREGLASVDDTIVCHNAKDGYDALELLQKIEKPDLIFLDINMPKMGGWECLQNLKRNPSYKDVAVLIYSTSSFEKDIDTAADLGAWGFYTKPDDFKSLKKTLQIILERFEKGSRSNDDSFNFNKIAV